MPTTNESPFYRWLRRALPVESGEWRAVGAAFGLFLLLMASYQIMRPIREALVSELKTGEKQWLFLSTFVGMLAATPVWGWLVSVLPRQKLVHIVIHFFAANVLGFAIWFWFVGKGADAWLSRLFFVWISVFSLFMTSMFWSVMVDVFSEQQGRRLFGLIASGATVGALLGAAIASTLAPETGIFPMALASAAALEFSLFFAAILNRVSRQWSRENRQQQQKPGGIWEGLVAIAGSRYLLTIGLYLGLISFCGTMVYMQLTDTAQQALPDRDVRTGFFARLNFFSQLGTLFAQSLLVGWLMRWVGLGWTLAILPGIYCCCFILLGLNHSLAVLGLVDVMTRIGVYGITVPSREVLFTVTSRDAKYKSKNFIDTVVFRGADSVASNIYTSLKGLSLALPPIGWLMLPVTLAWGFTGWHLGRQQNRLANRNRNGESLQRQH